ncbi:hypothetical protein [Pseudomonas sp. TE50-2]|uniref:hypothetical protein n=1 Tax=Pseudomonas sp. TE50-2 TaxID=3142707 RepID=UPI0034668747
MSLRRPGRVFMGLREVSGHYKGLCEGFASIGVRYDYLNIEENAFAFKGGDEAHGAMLLRSLKRKRVGSVGWRRGFYSVLQSAAHVYVFVFYLVRCRYFIFSAGASFCRLLDLPVLRLFGKRIIFQYHGSDSRLPFIDGARYSPEMFSAEQAWQDTLSLQRNVELVERYANYIVNIQPQSNLLRQPYIQWMQIGVAAKPEQHYIERGWLRFRELCDKPSATVLKVIHSPSLPHAKGTARIRSVIEALVAEGWPIDYQEVTGVANDSLIELLLGADIVIDQLYSDYPMPSLATECAWLHVPLLIFGYAGEHWAKWLPAEAIPPTAYGEPETLKEALKLMVESKTTRITYAETCFNFVHANWQPAQVAARYMALFKDDLSKEWWAVRDNSYRLGACLDRADSEGRISRIGQKAEFYFRNRGDKNVDQ